MIPPTLENIQMLFSDGEQNSLNQLIEFFGCDEGQVIQYLTRRNGFVKRNLRGRSVWDYNPLVAESMLPIQVD